MAGAGMAPVRSAFALRAPRATNSLSDPRYDEYALPRAAGVLHGRVGRASLFGLCLAGVLLFSSAAEAARAKKKARAPKKAKPPAVCMTEYRRGLKLEEGEQLL